MKRFDDWDVRLIDYILEVRKQPFSWDGFHCLTFANDAVIAQCGQGALDPDIFKFKTAAGGVKIYKKMLRKYGKTDLAGLVDTVLDRHQNLMPPRGAIVGRENEHFPVVGMSLGVSVGDLVAFLGPEKVIFSEVQDDDIFWIIPDA